MSPVALAPAPAPSSEQGTRTDGAATWIAFAQAPSNAEFCQAWLALQCGAVELVRAGLLLLREREGASLAPAAVWPDSRVDLAHLAAAAERAVTERRGLVVTPAVHDGQQVRGGGVHVAYPIDSDGELQGVVVLDVRARPEAELQGVLRQLLWGTGWLVAMLRKDHVAGDRERLKRAAIALDLVQAAHEHRTLDEAAVAVVNELATALKVHRVSIGIERKGRLQLRAISRTAWFDRKSVLVETLENAMDEVLDQETSAAYPQTVPPRAPVNAAQRDLATRSGSSAVITVPLPCAGRAIGALTLEHSDAGTFDAEAVDICEAAGHLLGPVFASLLEQERWFAGRAAEVVQGAARKLVGPRHPAFKLGALAVLIAAVFLAFAEGEFRVSARTLVEGEIQRAAVAPFDGYVAEAFARAGDTVRRGALLATLEDRELKLERTRWQAEKEQAERKYNDALAKHDRAAARVLAAQRDQVDAQLALAEEKLLRAQLVAPFDAVVVSGDLSQMLGAPVERGKVLFEIAPLDSYRVVLEVDERDVAYVAAGAPGVLALTGISGVTLPFTVKRVTSVSTAKEGRNFFRAEAQLQDASSRLRPGMEGIGKVAVGERRLVWIWTRNFVNWLRTSLWAWLP